jgi:hypothetical protein
VFVDSIAKESINECLASLLWCCSIDALLQFGYASIISCQQYSHHFSCSKISCIILLTIMLFLFFLLSIYGLAMSQDIKCYVELFRTHCISMQSFRFYFKNQELNVSLINPTLNFIIFCHNPD